MKKSSSHPPKLADRILKWYCANRYFEEVQGDLHEWFYQRVEEQGLLRARWMYYVDVVRYFRSFRLKSTQKINNNSNYLSMKNLLKLTLRNLRRDLLSAFLRIGNLALGMVVFLLTLVYARYELNYDQFHENHERVYRMGHKLNGDPWAAGPMGLGAFLQADAPEVERMTRIFPAQDTWIKKGDQVFTEQNVFFTDSSFFEVFTHKAIDGVLSESLKDIRSIVITESMAIKYFGTENPIGQELELGAENGRTRMVTAVIEDVPEQSHLQFDFLLPLRTFGERFTSAWRNWATYTYAELYEGADQEALNARVKNAYLTAYKGNDPDNLDCFLTPIADIHLKTNHEKELADNGNTSYVYILLSIGVFVLLISGINFMNLSVIKGLDRGKEVGLRKTLGATRPQIIAQFIAENLVTIVISAIISVLALAALSPIFSNFSELNLPLNGFYNTNILWPLGLLVLFLELICGVYPAMVLSRYKPAQVLKAGMKGSIKSGRVSFLRKGLIVMQFGISLILVISSILIYNQVDFIQNRDMGFEKDQILLVQVDGEIRPKLSAFVDGLESISGVQDVTISSDVPGYRISMEAVIEIGVTKPGDAPNIRTIMSDVDFVNVYGLSLREGRDFRQEQVEGVVEYLVNESAAALIFEDRNPLEGRIVYRGDTGRVVGILKDFNFRTVHSQVEPLVISSNMRSGVASIRFEPQSTKAVLDGIDELSKSLFPEAPSINAEFLSDRFAQLYKAESKLKSLVWLFCVISIVLTMSGIFGMASYMARQKTREIAIRKVLGSSVNQLFALMSRSFAWLLLLAIVLALPTAYYLSGWWLSNFAYQVPVAAWAFIGAVAAVFLLILFSSGLVTFRAIKANPTEALKSD